MNAAEPEPLTTPTSDCPTWLALYDMGFSLIPLKPRDKTPLTGWRAYQKMRASRSDIEAWYKATPNANIGIVTGAISGLVVLDLDSVDAIAEAERRGLPDTLMVRSGKGRHVYFRHPGCKTTNRAGFLPGMDIRGDGGYIVGPGSIHPSGALYSSEECGSIALQCPEGGQYHVMAEGLYVEVLREDGTSADPGEVGRVTITDLLNFAMPLIRYDIGDYAVAGGPCACGRGLPTLQRIVGRERNLVRFPDGRRHWPLVGFQRFSEAAPVRQYQVIQTALGRVELRVSCDSPLSPTARKRLPEIVREALGYPFEVDLVEFRNRLPLGPNGKFEEFICRSASEDQA